MEDGLLVYFLDAYVYSGVCKFRPLQITWPKCFIEQQPYQCHPLYEIQFRDAFVRFVVHGIRGVVFSNSTFQREEKMNTSKFWKIKQNFFIKNHFDSEIKNEEKGHYFRLFLRTWMRNVYVVQKIIIINWMSRGNVVLTANGANKMISIRKQHCAIEQSRRSYPISANNIEIVIIQEKAQ